MADTYTLLFLVSLVLYAAEMAWLRAGMRRADNSPSDPTAEPVVSVIVAARNEEDTIGDCIDALARLEYPPAKLEIIIVNDHSTDGTAQAIQKASSRCPRLKMISSTSGSGDMRGKANALAQGIDAAAGDILAFTDADCRVPPGWVRSIVSRMDSDAGIVGGYTLLRTRTTFDGMQGLDWLFLCSVAAGTAGWGLPLTAIGNNLAVRKQAYTDAGGYRSIPFSVTEDYALVQAILTKTRYKIRFPMEPAMAVESNPCPSWGLLLRQKQRWGVGGLDMVFRGLVVMAIGWACKVLLLAGILVLDPPVLIAGFITKALLDAWVLALPLGRFGAAGRLRHVLAFEAFFMVYVPLLPIVALLSKHRVVWKGRSVDKM